MNTEEQAPKTGTATYCPEDNKLRLYIGRVPRDEYETLRAEGWTALHKQREAGKGDFVATWTPERRDRCFQYADAIEDEDAGPAERAADRAERFAGYRAKRTAEASGHADRYDAGPTAHGFQNYARAVRAADRHDRIADRALDSWNCAEYWTRRTAGVIAHALHVSTPSVRMGRIKELEADARRIQKQRDEAAALFKMWRKIEAMTDPAAQTQAAERFAGMGRQWSQYTHPRTGKNATLWDHIREENPDRITGAEACALFFAHHIDPSSEAWNDTRAGEWAAHYAHRLAYENQMLEAQGGRAAHVEIQPGGKIAGRVIAKVNKSNASGRVVSVHVIGPSVKGWTYKAANVPGTDFALYQIETERLAPDAYTPPTPETLAELEAFKKAKAGADKPAPLPFVNPTDTDAERLQAIWNEQRAEFNKRHDKKAAAVRRMTQAEYTAAKASAWNHCGTAVFTGGGKLSNASEIAGKLDFPAVAKVRALSDCVVILTDKPQKSFPAEVWKDPRPQVLAEVIARADELRAALCLNWTSDMSAEQRQLVDNARRVGVAYVMSQCQKGLTDLGHKLLPPVQVKKLEAKQEVLAI